MGKRLEFQQENTPSSPAAFALHLVRVLAPPFSLLAKKKPRDGPLFSLMASSGQKPGRCSP